MQILGYVNVYRESGDLITGASDLYPTPQEARETSAQEFSEPGEYVGVAAVVLGRHHLPAGWIAIPAVGTRVQADHPITPGNPEETFVVKEISCLMDTRTKIFVRGENTIWFSIDLISPVGVQDGDVSLPERR